jgi:hypothetical protein
LADQDECLLNNATSNKLNHGQSHEISHVHAELIRLCKQNDNLKEKNINGNK